MPGVVHERRRVRTAGGHATLTVICVWLAYSNDVSRICFRNFRKKNEMELHHHATTIVQIFIITGRGSACWSAGVVRCVTPKLSVIERSWSGHTISIDLTTGGYAIRGSS